jgi:opine dehydrogenase
MAVAAALGAKVLSLVDWIDRVYGVREPNLVETMQRLTYNPDGAYMDNKAVSTLNHKYITEDVPTGLIAISALGSAARVHTPAIDALVEVVRHMMGRTFAEEARTLDRMGLAGLDAAGIRDVVSVGFPPNARA